MLLIDRASIQDNPKVAAIASNWPEMLWSKKGD